MFYCWAQEAASKVTHRIVEANTAVPEVKVCTASLRLMLQILNWDFRYITGEAKSSLNVFTTEVMQDGDSPRRSECNLVQVINFFRSQTAVDKVTNSNRLITISH